MAMPMPNLNMPTPPATKGKRPLRHLTATDKIEAIQRIHDGESKASVARDIGVPESTLRGWCKNEEKLRYMSRQSQENAEKLGGGAMGGDYLGGPPDKRMKIDPNFFVNGKMKYDELQRFHQNRGPIGGLDLSGGGDKPPRLDFGSLGSPDYTSALSALNNKANKSGGVGYDMKSMDNKTDLSMAAISPLTSLSHLSSISSLGQSFNEIASNLNLLAHLNSPSMAAMSGMASINSAAAAAAAASSSKGLQRPPKNPSLSPRAENDKSPSLTVKNLAKLQGQKNEDLSGMAALIDRHKKAQSQAGTPPVDDALWYWLKSQQMLGLNNLYSMPRPASPQCSSPALNSSTGKTTSKLCLCQYFNPNFPSGPLNSGGPMTKIPTPPIVSTTPQGTPPPTSSTPDEKTSSWFWQWYKNFGSSFQPDSSSSVGGPGNGSGVGISGDRKSASYDNILYSQLTKSEGSGGGNHYHEANSQSSTPKPEDLSSGPLPHSPGVRDSPVPSPVQSEPGGGDDTSTDSKHANSVAKVKEELDNVLYNNNNNNEKDELSDEPDDSIKTSLEALEHGEKFLKWLETCSDPSVTAMQVMQFRLLITSLKSSAERSELRSQGGAAANICEEKPKIRRRK